MAREAQRTLKVWTLLQERTEIEQWRMGLAKEQ